MADLFLKNSYKSFLNNIRLLGYLFFFISTILNAQEKNQLKSTSTLQEIEEIPVTVFIDNVGKFDLNVLYTTNELVYIPIENLFRPINIACQPMSSNDVLEGFIAMESNRYKVDDTNKQITIGSKIHTVEKDLIKETGVLYLESSRFNEIFGIELSFNFRSLSIKLKANFELPIVKQARIEKMQSNISKVKGDVKVADTIIDRNFHLLKSGTLDWNVASYQNWKGQTNNMIGLGIGAELLYGEATISANYNDQYRFNNRQLNYLWRWIDNDKKFIKQAQLGKISVQSISSLNAPLIGATVRNTPTTIRKATGSYTISEITEPDWKVELYINNVLVDFTTADAAGNFRFKVPIVYGYTTLKLKYYGPMGEERVEERVTNVPYTVMPVKEFEYGVSAGVLQDSTHRKYGKGEFYYGLSRKITVGGGLEYLSGLTEDNVIPFAKATFQPFSKLTLNAEYAHGVRSRGLINYYLSRDILLELDYSNYVEGQTATLFNASEELKAKLSIPYKYHQLNGYLKLDYAQLKYASFDFNYGYVMLSANYKQLNANTSAQLNWINHQNPFMTNDFILSYRLKNNIILRPSAKYNMSDKTLISYKAEIEKSSYLGHFTLSYEKNYLANNYFINLSFKYDLPFARVSTVTTHSKGSFTTSESAQGSFAFGGGNQYIHSGNNSSLGKGGLLLYPFLDINNNGKLDKGEKLVKLSTVNISGGKAIFSEKDSIIRIPDLNAFTNYTLTLSDTDLENISWRFKHHTYQVLIDPNQFKRIDIPIKVVGEVSGLVSRTYQNTSQGIARILVKFYEANSDKLIAETLSESDGYMYYLGLKPGNYRACIDAEQLKNLELIANPTCHFFTIRTLQEGDIVDDVNFVLFDRKKEQPINLLNKVNNNPLESELQMKKGVVSTQPSNQEHETTNSKIFYKLQLMASRKPVNIDLYFAQILSKIPSLQINETHQKNSWYRYHAGIFNNRTDAKNLLNKIKATGWKDGFIAPFIAVDTLNVEPTKVDLKIQTVQDPINKTEDVETDNLEDSFLSLYKPWYAHNINKKEHGKIVYMVQLMASRSAVNTAEYFYKIQSKFPDIPIIETLQNDGWYRYQIGIYNTPKEAMAMVQQIKTSGWKDFFIAPYISIKVISF